MEISIGEVILIYCCDKQYNKAYMEYPFEKESEYSESFKIKYNIENVNLSLKELKRKGYIEYQLPSERLRILKKEKLKEILHSKNISDTGKKSDLIDKIKKEFSEMEISFFTDKKYKVSLSGKRILNQYEYIVFLYKHNNFVISIDEFVELKNRYPRHSWKDLMWGDLQRVTSELFNEGKNEYITGYYNQAEFLEYEKRYKDAFSTYITVCIHNISMPALMIKRSRDKGIPENLLTETYGFNAPCDYVPKGVLKRAKECVRNADLSEEETYNIVKRNFDLNPPLLMDDSILQELFDYIINSLIG